MIADRIMIDRLTPRWAAVDCRIVGRARVGMEPSRAYPSGSRILILQLLTHLLLGVLLSLLAVRVIRLSALAILTPAGKTSEWTYE